MVIEHLNIQGLALIKPKVFEDPRGHFFEFYHQKNMKDQGIDVEFVQDNQSLSNKGVLRGLHFQRPPFDQGKLVRVIKGSVLDVAVDIRKDSPTYGQHHAVELSEANKLMFYVPTGFAHGFLTLEDNTIFTYMCSNYYDAASEDGIAWDDPVLNIEWNISEPLLSEKDKNARLFTEFKSPF